MILEKLESDGSAFHMLYANAKSNSYSQYLCILSALLPLMFVSYYHLMVNLFSGGGC